MLFAIFLCLYLLSSALMMAGEIEYIACLLQKKTPAGRSLALLWILLLLPIYYLAAVLRQRDE